MKPYSELEKNYLIETRVQEQIKVHGNVQKAIDYCKTNLKECEES